MPTRGFEPPTSISARVALCSTELRRRGLRHKKSAEADEKILSSSFQVSLDAGCPVMSDMFLRTPLLYHTSSALPRLSLTCCEGIVASGAKILASFALKNDNHQMKRLGSGAPVGDDVEHGLGDRDGWLPTGGEGQFVAAAVDYGAVGGSHFGWVGRDRRAATGRFQYVL